MSEKISVVILICVFLLTNFMISNDLVKASNDDIKIYSRDVVAGKNWTFMFYDDADFNNGYDPLEDFAEQAYSGENLDVIVLQDTNYGPAKIWYINENHTKHLLKEMGEINMGAYETLRDFILYCKENFSADRYIISFYNHGSGWQGCCNDDTNNDSLTMNEIQKAFVETDGVDIVCFSAPCLMGALESVYELKDYTDVYIGSEETSGYGWWDSIMKPLCDTLNQDPGKSNIELGARIIQLIDNDSYNKSFSRENLTMSAIRTDKMNDLGAAIDILSQDIINNFEESYPIIKQIYQDVQSFFTGRFLDFYDFAEKYQIFETNQTINTDLEYVLENLTEAVIAETHGSNKPGAHGLSINFLNTSNPIYDTKYADLDYGLDFAYDTHWDELLEKIWLEKSKGIAVGSNIVGTDSSISGILDFIEDCNINMLIVDFGWITWSWNNTLFDYVGNLINESKEKKISTWLMYRARTLEGEYEHLQHQVHKNGEVDGRHLCFTDDDNINWSISWAHKMLEKYPTVDGIILYNPMFFSDCCYCPVCLERFKNDTGIVSNPIDFDLDSEEYKIWIIWRKNIITDFINQWKNNISDSYPELQFGIVVNSGEGAEIVGQNITSIGEIVDLICPFVVLDSVTETDFASDIINEVKGMTNVRVISDIKIYGPYTNTNEDIINAITGSLNSNGNGFFIWDYDSLISGNYNIESIKRTYNPYYFGWYSPYVQEISGGILQVYVGIIMVIIAALSIAILFFYERKEKTK